MTTTTKRPYQPLTGPISADAAHAEPPARRAFPEESLPADLGRPKNETAKPVTIRIDAVFEGYAIAVSFEGNLTQLPGAIERLRAAGATPTAQPAQQWSYTPDGLPICPRHGAPMKKRSKQGDEWYSHVVTDSKGDDVYCRGYKGKDSPGYEC